ncbi:MAG: glucan 1,4-alpha-glucosidase [Gammaproteobacteria bacterium]
MNSTTRIAAPGAPGNESRWTSSAKSGVGTSVTAQGPVWFTLSHGIVNEVYYPRLDQANIRDLGFIVTDGRNFFSEEKRHASPKIEPVASGVPAYRLVNSCVNGRYRLHKTICTDPRRPCLLQHVRFEALSGTLADYQLYALLAPHLANHGAGNDGWLGEHKGWPMLFAQRDGTALALACSVPWRAATCGYVGRTDGWQDLHAHKRLTGFYTDARAGNIALTGEIDLARCQGEFVLVLAFGSNAAEAGQRALASLIDPFESLLDDYVAGWQDFQKHCLSLSAPDDDQPDLYRTSTAVLKTHLSDYFVGGMIASLSVPWGFSKGDNDLGGYHLVWPRDQVESAGALLASGNTAEALDVLRYLLSTQEADGHWPQNMWLDGSPYWNGIQLDEAAFPVLLADALRRGDGLDGVDVWPVVRRAAGFVARNGPVTLQDRWEEDGGYSPFTLAVVVAGLLAAADFATRAGEESVATYLRETADMWNSQIESWTYVSGTPLARKIGVDGYYIRIAPPETADAASPAQGFVPIKNRPPGASELPMTQLISPDALALVRFGLRAADDPRIVNTVKVIDALLKTETSTGPVWHRYNDDGYGEHEDGSPFDGTGTGRGWPLLGGERAHYELAAGRPEEANRLRKVMEAQAGPGDFFPEQVWDAADIPERELTNGQPSGSAMPLVWAHAEYIKLLRSLKDGRVFDLPPQTVERYQTRNHGSPHTSWRFTHKSRVLPSGKLLRIETLAAARVRWSVDNWTTIMNSETRDTGLGIHVVDLPTSKLQVGSNVCFTFYWPDAGRWEGMNFSVAVRATGY